MHKDFSLSFEWEVVVLNAFSKKGRVVYEKDFGGPNRGDIYFAPAHVNQRPFLADIATVSDSGMDKANAFNYLFDELLKRAKDIELNPDAFALDVGAHEETHYRGGPNKVRLKLPGRTGFQEKIFSKSVDEFLQNVLKNTSAPAHHVIKNDEIDITIRYNPNQRYATGSHLSYKVVYSLTNNIVYQALSAKAAQLKGTRFDGPLGIVLCDGSCSFLRDRGIGNLSWSLREVIFHFLKENPTISFILTLTVKRERGHSILGSQKNQERVFIDLYKGNDFNKIGYVETLSRELIFPCPQLDAQNALNHLKAWPNRGPRHYGEMTMTIGGKADRTSVKISARAILERLAGRLSDQEFAKQYDFIAKENPFEQALEAGHLLVSLERSEEEDDDWIIFEFDGPDPAISSFRLPSAKK